MTEEMMDKNKIKLLGDECPIKFEQQPFGNWFHIESWMNNSPCVYILCTQKEVVYVGQSTYIIERLGKHISGEMNGKKKDFEGAYVIHVKNEAEMNKLEEYLIKRHQPKYNTIGKGNIV